MLRYRSKLIKISSGQTSIIEATFLNHFFSKTAFEVPYAGKILQCVQ